MTIIVEQLELLVGTQFRHQSILLSDQVVDDPHKVFTDDLGIVDGLRSFLSRPESILQRHSVSHRRQRKKETNAQTWNAAAIDSSSSKRMCNNVKLL